jgi:hypothetical protein
MHGVWKSWMTIWCVATLALGVALAAMAFPQTDALGRAYYLLAAGGDADAITFDAPGARFSIAVLGAVTIGWGITILALIREAAPGGPGWRGLTAAIVGWYAIDSALSVATGFPVNALLNTGFLASFLVPVIGSGVLSDRQAAAA